MEAMTKHRCHSAAFKRQVAEEFIAGETLHALSKRHDISRQFIRIWLDIATIAVPLPLYGSYGVSMVQ
jgi:transposase-like protein